MKNYFGDNFPGFALSISLGKPLTFHTWSPGQVLPENGGWLLSVLGSVQRVPEYLYA